MQFTGTVQWHFNGKSGTGDQTLIDCVDSSIRNIKNFRPFFKQAIAYVLEPSTAEQFDTEGRSGGTPWPELSPATIARRSRGRLKFDTAVPGILRRTGRLYDSFFGGDDHIQDITDMSLEWGTSVPYAPPHQMGAESSKQGELFSPRSKRSKRLKANPHFHQPWTLPARPMIVLNPKMRDGLNEQMANFLSLGLERAGWKVNRVGTLRGPQLGFFEGGSIVKSGENAL